MRPTLLMIAGILALIVCACTTNQRLTYRNADYRITWSGKELRGIHCCNANLPKGVVEVRISHGHNWKKVAINSGNPEVWASALFKLETDELSSRGIRFYRGPEDRKRGGREVLEWTYDATGIVIYKEVVGGSKNAQFICKEAFGPFGLRLHPPE